MTDFHSPQDLVAALYAALSGEPGRERQWERFRQLFLPDARLRIVVEGGDGVERIGDWTVEGFIDHARSLYAEQGFWESELSHRVDRFGHIAHVFSTYETRIGSRESKPVARGINSIQAILLGGRWWIAGILFHVEQPDTPIPQEYLGGFDPVN